MSAKKKKEIAQVTANVEQTKPEVDQLPAPEIPETQIEIVSQVETPAEPKVEIVSAIEPAKVESVTEPAKPAKIESATTPIEPTPHIEAPTPTPKPLTLESLQAEIDELRQIISQLSAIPVKQQRKPVASNGKVGIRDLTTGKEYVSKNATYKALLASHELDKLVADGVFGSDPKKNNFGCYQLFRSFPGRFQEIKSQEIDTNQEVKPA
jgi:hypothetical protein